MTKLLLDENVPRDVKIWLKNKGFDVVSVSSKLFEGVKDRVIANYAAKNRLAIVTLDQGFARIFRTYQKGTLTVIVIKAKPATSANIIAILNIAQEKIDLKEIVNKLVVLTKKKIRIIT